VDPRTRIDGFFISITISAVQEKERKSKGSKEMVEATLIWSPNHVKCVKRISFGFGDHKSTTTFSSPSSLFSWPIFSFSVMGYRKFRTSSTHREKKSADPFSHLGSAQSCRLNFYFPPAFQSHKNIPFANHSNVELLQSNGVILQTEYSCEFF
jgi:hypothetical protein